MNDFSLLEDGIQKSSVDGFLKLFVKIYFLIFIMGLGIVILYNYWQDPLQYYRFSHKKLNVNDRWQVASFIQNADYDQVILGTSMTQNFSPVLLKSVMGTKAIRMSVKGLPIQEQAIILKSAIKTGKVKSVIWGIDREFFNYEQGRIQSSFPETLYYRNFMGHLHYLVNVSTTYSSIKNILNFKTKNKNKIKHQVNLNGNETFKENEDLEFYNTWYEKDAQFSKEKILKIYEGFAQNYQTPLFEVKDLPKIMVSQIEFQTAMKKKLYNFEEDVYKVILNNPNVQFYVFHPPYSIAQHKFSYKKDPKYFLYDAEFRKHIIEKLSSLPNVLFFDFETDLNIVANLNNYKDLTHYSKEINDFMIECFNKKQNLISRKTLENNHQVFLSLPTLSFE